MLWCYTANCIQELDANLAAFDSRRYDRALNVTERAVTLDGAQPIFGLST